MSRGKTKNFFLNLVRYLVAPKRFYDLIPDESPKKAQAPE